MHPQQMRQRRYDALATQQAKGKSIGDKLGIKDAGEKAAPTYSNSVRSDPALAELYDHEALASLLVEIDVKLESLNITGTAPPTSVEEVDGVSPQVQQSLADNGYLEIADLQAASVEDLVAVPHIGQARAEQIKEHVGGDDDG